MEDTSSNLGPPPPPPPPGSDGPRPGPIPAPANNRPTPQTLWQAYQLAKQWCWDRRKELEGGSPTPHRNTDPDPGGAWKPDKMPYKTATLRLHAGLPKPHSSLLTQIRTGKIGLAAFLHQCRVPGFESPACPCGWQWETAKHIILDCPRFAQE